MLLGIICLPCSLATADEAADTFMKEMWRRYKTAPSLVSIINGRTFDEQGRVNDLARFVVFCSERGELRVTTPTATWVYRAGQVYSDSAYFPGSYINTLVGGSSGAALEAMQSMWPTESLPTEVYLRMASTWQDAFKPFFEFVGPDAKVELEEGTWASDNAPAILIKFSSADGATRATIWVDRNTNLLRGTLLEDASGYVSSVSEPELRARLGQEIRFATTGRTKFEDFEAISSSFNTRYSMPSPGEASDSTESQ